MTKKILSAGSSKQHSEWRRMYMAFFGFFILFSETGVRQVMNIFVTSITVAYNCTKTEVDTVVIVLPTASSLMAGPVSAMFYQIFGARVCILCGALLCFTGFSLGSVAPSMLILSIFAVLIGFGCALMRNAIISVQCEYFTSMRNTVMSFISIGPGIGIFLLPRILVSLINKFSWSFGFRFLATLYIICGIMAIFITKRSTTQQHSFAHFTGIKVWMHIGFWFHAISSFCASSVCIIYFSNILSLMRAEGVSEPEVVYSYHGIASIIGRSLLTLFLGFTNANILLVMIFNYVVAQCSIFSASFCSTLWEFRIQNVFAGVGIGFFQATLAQFLLSMVGPSQLPGALGYTNLVNGAAAFTAVHIAGFVSQHYESMRAAFYPSIMFGICAIFFAVINSVVIFLRQSVNAEGNVNIKEVEFGTSTMFGYVLVSNTNKVISFGGDDDFNDYLHSRVQDEAYFSPECPSTSSGVCTDSSTESLSSVDGRKTSTQASKNHLSSTKEEASHLFLPLISMYRSYIVRSGDRIESVVYSQSKILLRHLKCNYIVISIGNSEERQKRLLDFLEMGLELNIGPLLEFIDLKLMTVRLGSEFVESVSENCILENYKIREFLDVRKALFFQTELTFTLPFLKSFSSKLLNTVGSNRCYLLSGGEVLASNTSDRKSKWDSVTISSLTLFFQLLSKRKYLKQYESVSLWLHSYKSAAPIFTDTMIYNNGSAPMLLCLSEAKYGSIISTIANLLQHLDNLAFSEHFTRDVPIIRKMVEIISKGLHSIETDKTFTRKAGFMRSPSRTATFLQTIWQRTENLFKGSCDKNLALGDHLWTVSSSLLSLKSAFSTISLASPIAPTTTIRNENFSIKCEMMMKYFRRQVINILQELCFQSFEASKMKLAQFRETMSHMASMLPGNMISDRNIALALEKKSALLKDFMHPAALGLDMIAYSVSIPTKLVTVDFIPDWISNEFNSLLRSLEDCSGVTSISMKSEKRYILYRVSEMNVERETPHTRFGLLKYLHVDIRSKMTAVAFFEEEFYKQFAERQVSRLLDIIANQMSSGILFIS